jgi:hypothetical protein
MVSSYSQRQSAPPMWEITHKTQETWVTKAGNMAYLNPLATCECLTINNHTHRTSMREVLPILAFPPPPPNNPGCSIAVCDLTLCSLVGGQSESKLRVGEEG